MTLATGAGAPRLGSMRLQIEGAIGTLVLDRAEENNALNAEMVGDLCEVTAWLANRARLRALIITGAGRVFCAGGDVALFRELIERDDRDAVAEVRQGLGALNEAILSLRRIPYPVIAAVNGAATGAGLALALACDVRIASDRASFLLAYSRLGACPDAGMSYFLPRIVGPARALELLLEDRVIRASRAVDEGLVSEVVAHDELEATAQRRATRLAAAAPYYVREVKRLLSGSLSRSLPDQLELERHALADALRTQDFRRGIEALFDGRKPEFEGC